MDILFVVLVVAPGCEARWYQSINNNPPLKRSFSGFIKNSSATAKNDITSSSDKKEHVWKNRI